MIHFKATRWTSEWFLNLLDTPLSIDVAVSIVLVVDVVVVVKVVAVVVVVVVGVLVAALQTGSLTPSSWPGRLLKNQFPFQREQPPGAVA